MTRLGRLYGVGLGPGDPELVTRKAERVIRSADVIAYHSGTHGRSIARGIAADLIPLAAIEEAFPYPVTTGVADHPGGYNGSIADFYDVCAAKLAVHLEAGLTVAVLCEGDPLFYGSYMYLHDRLADRFAAVVIPGITSMSAAAAASARPLVRRSDVLTILPGTLPEHELARRLADTDAAIVMKLGRTFTSVRNALAQAGRLDDAVYVERASTAQERVAPVSDVDADSVPYFSLVLAPGDGAPRNRSVEDRSRPERNSRQPPAGIGTESSSERKGEVMVVGIGPADEKWLTPEVSKLLSAAEHVVGYGPYVARVPVQPLQKRYPSGNTVEIDRARLALQLAADGGRVAVVSGGDAGIFGMATAVYEAALDPRFHDVPIKVFPGVSAFQVVAARAGAPVGGDFAVVNLSDRLKPWHLLERRLHLIGQADLVLALYNPASNSRTTQLASARRIMLTHRPGTTVVVIGRDIGRDDDTLEVTTLADFDPATVDMRCLVMIGSSLTRVHARTGAVWTARSTTDTASPPSPTEYR